MWFVQNRFRQFLVALIVLILFLTFFQTIFVFNGKNFKLEEEKIRYAGMLTPYSIIPGGGERYLLSSAKALQLQGYFVVIMVFNNNPCKTIQFLKQTATTLRVDLDYNKINLKVVQYDGRNKIKGFRYKFETFYYIGNEKVPTYFGIGSKLNIYMCQFPFDMQDSFNSGQAKALASYDLVILNSQYTYKWYGKVAQPVFDEIKRLNLMIPNVRIVYPPVDPFSIQSKPPLPLEDSTINIVMIGRFFVGRQSKGQDKAVEILSSLLKKTNRKLHLTLIGNVHPNVVNFKFVDDLKKNATNLPITFLFDASSESMTAALAKSNIFWHLTGINQLELSEADQDPASFEHFGISIVEAMAAGCIPIVLDKGGTRDIVTHEKNGFLARSVDDVIAYTLELIAMDSEKYKKIQENSMETSKKFHISKFLETFNVMTIRARMASVVRNSVSPVMSEIRKIKVDIPISSNLIAVIIEPDISSLFEFVIYNVMLNLNRYSSWSLQVYYSEKNELFIKSVLSAFSNVHLIKLPFPVANTQDYNRLLKSPLFWKEVKLISDFYLKNNLKHNLENSNNLKNSNIFKKINISSEQSKVLIFQSDTMIVNNNENHNINNYLEYDYIGAPWDSEHNLFINHLQEHKILNNSVGNGGFSLRNLDAMINITSLYGNDKSPELSQEDVFFAHFINKLNNINKNNLNENNQNFEEEKNNLIYKIPSDYTAYKFAKEVSIQKFISKQNNNIPIYDFDHFAYHAAWYYMESKKFSEIFNKFILKTMMKKE